MRPSDSLMPIGRGSGSPCLWPTPRWVTFLIRSPACTHQRRGRPGFAPCWLPSAVSLGGDTRASQVSGSSSCCVPDSNTPPGPSAARPSRALGSGRPPTAFAGGPYVRLPWPRVPSPRFRLRPRQRLGHPGMTISGLNAPAHTFACLRIARAVVATGARLATDLPGSALVGSVSHRLDDDSEFQGSIVPPFPPEQPCLVAP